MRARDALTLSETILGLRGRRDQAGMRRLAVSCTLALVGWAGMQTIGVSGMVAQTVKAPRYDAGIDTPTPRLNLPPLPPAISQHGVVVEDIVARVNDQIISRSDVERAAQQLDQDAAQNKLNGPELAQAQRDLLRDMIDEQLLLSKAKQLGLNADADVIRKLDEIRKENHMDSLDDLAKAAQAQGVNFEDFKAQIRNQILKQKVVGDEVGRKLQLSESEEQKYYKEHLADFQQPEQIKLSEILVPLPENPTPEQINQAEAKANDLKTKIMQGADFAELAKKYSGGPSAAQGGDLGMWKRGALAKVLEDQTFDLKAGQSTQPIRTRQGFVILKVTQHDPAGPAPMKEVEPQIQEAIYMQQMQPALRAYLTKLREDSYVKIAPGFVDSGAIPNEGSDIVFSAYAPPAKKEKKAKDKERFEGNARYQTVAAKTVVASPDTTGTRTITGPEAKPAIDPVTGLAVIAPARGSRTVAANGKPGKKIRKEKIRFGQAPRTTLSGSGAEDTTVAVNTVAAPAPGAVMASDSGVDTGNVDTNPLDEKAPVKKKERFASTEAAVKAKKAKNVSLKAQEKAVATPTPATDQEKADAAVQAAPLGLGGDTVKTKKKKVKKKKVKGQAQPPKERLADKAPTPKAAPATPAPTANPNLAPTDLAPTGSSAAPVSPPATVPNSSVPRTVPAQSDTTLPPVTQPVPGSTQTGQPVPGTNPPN
jgi:peptidyl-prolyl cis-trans isomerase SurA